MPEINWDKLSNKFYESGLDRGVLYLPDGSAVPWNGLVSVDQNFDVDLESVYMDGVKLNDLVTLGTFSASLSSVTYPVELDELNGSYKLRNGVYLEEQPPEAFALSYRTKVYNNDGSLKDYKIHIIYNVIAVPESKTYSTISDDPSLVEFEWELFATPEHITGYRPSSYVVIKVNELDPMLKEQIEKILYGSPLTNASLLPMQDLINYINNWFRIKITDNEDGTWTAESDYNYIFLYPDEEFRIEYANATFIDNDTYILTDTKDIKEVPDVKITDNGDGTWTASSSVPGSIVVTGDTYQLNNVTVEYLTQTTYLLSDSV